MKIKNSKKAFAAVLCLITAIVAAFGPAGKQKMSTKQLFAMDTSVTLKAKSKNLDSYSAKIKELDKKLSAYNSSSEISRLNENKSAELSDETVSLLNEATALSEKYRDVDITAGALVKLWNVNGENPQVPKQSEIDTAKATVDSHNLIIDGNKAVLKSNAQIDLGSCAKGYMLDILRQMFDENNESYAVVSFGSSSLVYGEKPDGESFITEIVNPEDKNKSVLRFKTQQCFISTSGGYERFFEADGKTYSHIINLETGYPAETDLTSVTVVCKNSGLLSDFMSTCIYIGGTDKIGEYLQNGDFEIIAIDKNKNIYCSESIKDKIEIIDEDFLFKKY